MVRGILAPRLEGGKVMPTPMATILFIDDDDPLRMLCQTALEGAGYRVLTADSALRCGRKLKTCVSLLACYGLNCRY